MRTDGGRPREPGPPRRKSSRSRRSLRREPPPRAPECGDPRGARRRYLRHAGHRALAGRPCTDDGVVVPEHPPADGTVRLALSGEAIPRVRDRRGALRARCRITMHPLFRAPHAGVVRSFRSARLMLCLLALATALASGGAAPAATSARSATPGQTDTCSSPAATATRWR